MKPSGVYRIFCTTNGKSYIGSSMNVGKRLRWHRNTLRQSVHQNPYLQNSWNKYGESAFEFRILEMCNESVLRQREKEIMDRVRPEFNCRGIDPHQSLTSFSAEARSKMSKASLGKPKQYLVSPEARENIRAAKMGHPVSLETRAKLRAASLGRPVSPETREKIRAAMIGHKNNLGYTHSPETRAKMSATRLGRPVSLETRAKISTARLGQHLSQETRAKISRFQKNKRSGKKLTSHEKIKSTEAGPAQG